MSSDNNEIEMKPKVKQFKKETTKTKEVFIKLVC